MTERVARMTVYTVRSVGGGYEVFDRTGRRRSERPEAKDDAVIRARWLATGAGAHILIYAKDGTFESSFFHDAQTPVE